MARCRTGNRANITGATLRNPTKRPAAKTDMRAMEKVPGIFPTQESRIGLCNVGEHKIELQEGAGVVCVKLRKCGPFKEAEMNRQTKEYLEMDIIEPSDSEFSSNVLLVPKRDNTFRFAVDYRELNAITKKNMYPMEDIQSIFDSLGGSSIFSRLDCLHGFFQVKLAEEDKHKTAFRVPGVPGGHYQFKRMCFGLQGSPGTFCRIIDRIFCDIRSSFLANYVGDLLTHSQSFEKHLDHLEEVCKRLQSAGLKIKPSKCFFGFDEVKFL